MTLQTWCSLFRKFFAVFSVCMLVACGGGGGAGASSGDSSAPSGNLIAGRVVLDGEPAVDRPIELARVDRAGNTVAVLRSARTSVNGDFQIDLGTDQSPGLNLALSATSSDGTVLRTLILEAGHTEVSVSSEAFTRELLARAQAPASVSAPMGRLTRLRNGVVTFLSLLPTRSKADAARVTELRAWILRDNASRQALDAIEQTGTLPVTLGDVGGMAGLGPAAWLATDSVYGGRNYVVRASSRDPNTFELFDMLATVPGTPVQTGSIAAARMQMSNDRPVVLQAMLPLNATTSEVLLAPYTTPIHMVPVGQAPGRLARTTYSAVPTSGITFDADNLEDRISRTVESTPLGTESISAFGTSLRAWRVDTVHTLTIELSGGGQRVLAERRSEWSVPFAGVVLARSLSQVVNPDGSTTTGIERTFRLDAGVSGGMSWPARLFAQSVPLQSLLDAQGREVQMTVLGPAPGNGVVLADLSRNPSNPTTLAVLDSVSGKLRAVRTLDYGGRRFARLALAPDGSQLYAAFSENAGGSFNQNYLRPEPIDLANEKGALVVRYETNRLDETLRQALPARPSLLLPGFAFARTEVGALVLSPGSPDQAAIGVHDGVILLNGSASHPVTLSTSALERDFLGTPQLDRALVDPIAYDVTREELLLRWVPDSLGLLQTGAMRVLGGVPDPSVLRHMDRLAFANGDFFSEQLTFVDGVVGDSLYADVMSARYSVASGFALARTTNRYGGAYHLGYRSGCGRHGSDATLEIICSRSGRFYSRNPETLEDSLFATVNNQLRMAAGFDPLPDFGDLMLLGQGVALMVSMPSDALAGELLWVIF